MTWHWDPETGAVYDHTGTEVANLVEDYNWDRTWLDSRDYPVEIERVMEAQLDGPANTPTVRNQMILIDLKFGRIEKGPP